MAKKKIKNEKGIYSFNFVLFLILLLIVGVGFSTFIADVLVSLGVHIDKYTTIIITLLFLSSLMVWYPYRSYRKTPRLSFIIFVYLAILLSATSLFILDSIYGADFDENNKYPIQLGIPIHAYSGTEEFEQIYGDFLQNIGDESLFCWNEFPNPVRGAIITCNFSIFFSNFTMWSLSSIEVYEFSEKNGMEEFQSLLFEDNNLKFFKNYNKFSPAANLNWSIHEFNFGAIDKDFARYKFIINYTDLTHNHTYRYKDKLGNEYFVESGPYKFSNRTISFEGEMVKRQYSYLENDERKREKVYLLFAIVSFLLFSTSQGIKAARDLYYGRDKKEDNSQKMVEDITKLKVENKFLKKELNSRKGKK